MRWRPERLAAVLTTFMNAVLVPFIFYVPHFNQMCSLVLCGSAARRARRRRPLPLPVDGTRENKCRPGPGGAAPALAEQSGGGGCSPHRLCGVHQRRVGGRHVRTKGNELSVERPRGGLGGGNVRRNVREECSKKNKNDARAKMRTTQPVNAHAPHGRDASGGGWGCAEPLNAARRPKKEASVNSCTDTSCSVVAVRCANTDAAAAVGSDASPDAECAPLPAAWSSRSPLAWCSVRTSCAAHSAAEHSCAASPSAHDAAAPAACAPPPPSSPSPPFSSSAMPAKATAVATHVRRRMGVPVSPLMSGMRTTVRPPKNAACEALVISRPQLWAANAKADSSPSCNERRMGRQYFVKRKEKRASRTRSLAHLQSCSADGRASQRSRQEGQEKRRGKREAAEAERCGAERLLRFLHHRHLAVRRKK